MRLRKIISAVCSLCIATCSVFSVSAAVSAQSTSDFSYSTTVNNTICITGYNSSSPNVQIPSKINGTAVTNIGASAFAGNTQIASLSIPDSVLRIDDNAFSGCKNLSSVVGGSYVEYIGEHAFLSTAWLDNYAENAVYIGRTLYSVKSCDGSFGIKDGTKSVSAWAFAYTDVESVTTPSSLWSFGSFAFWECDRLKSVSLGVEFEGFGNDVFHGCTALETVNVDRNSNYLCSVDGIIYTKNKSGLLICPAAYSGTFTLPSELETIYDCAFSDCTAVKTLTLPDGVTSVRSYAFRNCANLKSIFIPKNAKVQNNIFDGCGGLEKINVDANSRYYSSIDGVLFSRDKTKLIYFPQKNSVKYSVPNGTEVLGDSAFLKNPNLVSVTLPNTVREIERLSLAYCGKLTSVNIPSSVKTIGVGAFCDCTSLASVNIPNSVESLGASSLDNTKWLNSQPNGLVYIGKFLYKYKGTAPKGADIKVKKGTEVIVRAAFDGQVNISKITLPDGIRIIDFMAFNSCSSLKSVNLPKSLESINQFVFDGCNSMKRISVPNKTKLSTSVPYNITVYCSKDSDAHNSCLRNGSIYALFGDADRNYSINSKDTLVMRKKLAKWDVTLDEYAADCNLDGKFDSKDVLLLRKYLAQWNVELG